MKFLFCFCLPKSHVKKHFSYLTWNWLVRVILRHCFALCHNYFEVKLLIIVVSWFMFSHKICYKYII